MAQRADVGRTGTVRVSFVCQKCHHPLQLDDSFRSLNDRMQAELTGEWIAKVLFITFLKMVFLNSNRCFSCLICTCYIKMYLNNELVLVTSEHHTLNFKVRLWVIFIQPIGLCNC